MMIKLKIASKRSEFELHGNDQTNLETWVLGEYTLAYNSDD